MHIQKISHAAHFFGDKKARIKNGNFFRHQKNQAEI